MSVLAATLRDVVHWVKDWWLWPVSAVTATLGLYVVVRANFPTAAKVMIWPLRACGRCCAVVFFKAPRWFWRQMWRDRNGEIRTPLTRLRARRLRWHVAVITTATRPQFEASQAATQVQFDKQSARIDGLGDRIEKMEQRDDLVRRLDKLERWVQEIADAITQPTKRAARPPTKGSGT